MDENGMSMDDLNETEFDNMNHGMFDEEMQRCLDLIRKYQASGKNNTAATIKAILKIARDALDGGDVDEIAQCFDEMKLCV